jgi:hypothetical protein
MLPEKAPFEVGQIRVRQWQAAVTHGAEKAWRGRIAEYWQLQTVIYGIVLATPTLDFDVVDGVNIVTTSAVVLHILPGERTDDRKRWASHRLRNGHTGGTA